MIRNHIDDGSRYKTLNDRVRDLFNDFMAKWHEAYTEEQLEEISAALGPVSGRLANLQDTAGEWEHLIVKDILREHIPRAKLVLNKYGMGIKVLEEVKRDLNARLKELERGSASEPDPPYR